MPTLMEKVKASDLKYSPQAVAFLEAFKDDFPFEEFEAFVKKELFTVGGQHLLIFQDQRMKQKKEILANFNPLTP